MLQDARAEQQPARAASARAGWVCMDACHRLFWVQVLVVCCLGASRFGLLREGQLLTRSAQRQLCELSMQWYSLLAGSMDHLATH